MNKLIVSYYLFEEPNRTYTNKLVPHSEEDIESAMHFVAQIIGVEGKKFVLVDAHNESRETSFRGHHTCRYCQHTKEVWEKVQVPRWPESARRTFVATRSKSQWRAKEVTSNEANQ